MLCILILLLATSITWFAFTKKFTGTIKVGILHSLTGPMAMYEETALDATNLSISEINSNGGILGRKIIPIVADGKSDSTIFAQEAERLITEEKVAVIFGCWRSSDRKAVKAVVEKHKHLLFYPVQHEGLEDSPHIVYTSTIPNQQAVPAVTWCIKNLGTTFFLIGTDELFSKANNAIITETINSFDAKVVGELYVKPSATDMTDAIKKIVAAKPSVIINTMIGNTNFIFFKELRKAGITSEKIPTMSLTIDEPELQKYGSEYMMGDYSSWSHFQSIQRIENSQFVEKIKHHYGKEYVISDAMEAAYYGVYLWKQAIDKAESYETEKVIPALHNQSYNAPEGIVSIDDASLHTWSLSSIGKIRSDKQFTIVWNSDKAIPPRAYPFFKTPEEWNKLLDQWYKEWGNKWSSE